MNKKILLGLVFILLLIMITSVSATDTQDNLLKILKGDCPEK